MYDLTFEYNMASVCKQRMYHTEFKCWFMCCSCSEVFGFSLLTSIERRLVLSNVFFVCSADVTGACAIGYSQCEFLKINVFFCLQTLKISFLNFVISC